MSTPSLLDSLSAVATTVQTAITKSVRIREARKKVPGEEAPAAPPKGRKPKGSTEPKAPPPVAPPVQDEFSSSEDESSDDDDDKDPLLLRSSDTSIFLKSGKSIDLYRDKHNSIKIRRWILGITFRHPINFKRMSINFSVGNIFLYSNKRW